MSFAGLFMDCLEPLGPCSTWRSAYGDVRFSAFRVAFRSRVALPARALSLLPLPASLPLTMGYSLERVLRVNDVDEESVRSVHARR